uniref:Uncharacterized protein n=1 Tax=Pipistrellus kuhlii TaxID=59472 RepID=A0A7J7UG75_PIPKU|nr:hypothetical protein mPipKuh1_009077 [Pipistrellus kuhlii]
MCMPGTLPRFWCKNVPTNAGHLGFVSLPIWQLPRCGHKGMGSGEVQGPTPSTKAVGRSTTWAGLRCQLLAGPFSPAGPASAKDPSWVLLLMPLQPLPADPASSHSRRRRCQPHDHLELCDLGQPSLSDWSCPGRGTFLQPRPTTGVPTGMQAKPSGQALVAKFPFTNT